MSIKPEVYNLKRHVFFRIITNKIITSSYYYTTVLIWNFYYIYSSIFKINLSLFRVMKRSLFLSFIQIIISFKKERFVRYNLQGLLTTST